MKTLRPVSIISMTYAMISQTEVGYLSDFCLTYSASKINTLQAKKVEQWKAPYYVGGGRPSGAALPYVRSGLARAPPSDEIPPLRFRKIEWPTKGDFLWHKT
jgi:hypothetical protein